MRFGILAPVVLTSLYLFGCDSKTEEPVYDWQSPDPVSLLKEYHKANRAKKVSENNTSADGLTIYQDFSDGLQVAWKNANSKEFFNTFMNSLPISSLDFYSVAADTIIHMKGLSKEDVFEKVKNAKSYNKIYAPLDKALDQIVSAGKRAIFITDGELYNKAVGESDRPWAREGFAKWLSAGNKLSFYVTNYVEEKKEKHVFYMVFTPKDDINTEKDITTRLDVSLKQMSLDSLAFVSFHFNNNSYYLEKRYPTPKEGGVAEELEKYENYHINSEDNWEFVDAALPWSGIVAYLLEAKDDNTGKSKPKALFNKIFLDAKKLEFYKVNRVKIQVSDIYDDFYAYALDAHCKANPAKITKDAEDPTIKTIEDDFACYDSTGTVLRHPYSKKQKNILTTVFEPYDELFEDGMKESLVGEIRVRMKESGLDLSKLSREHENFFKIELVVEDFEPIFNNPNLKNFIWEGKRIEKNKAMYESVFQALLDAVPKGKVLYTWYLRTAPNDIEE
ncbi:MAG: hypothetical protein HUK20_11810 [Fibrobacter sp.]|nr:hypothetical protein [Fibrobacter sp.]